jgi:hypothetical protein
MPRRPAPAPATPSEQHNTVHSELHPGTGKGASEDAGPLHCVTRLAAGSVWGPPSQTSAQQTQSHTTRPPANNNRMEEGWMSCHQQPASPQCDAAKMSPRISIGLEPVLAAHAPSPSAAGSHCPVRESSAPHWGTEFRSYFLFLQEHVQDIIIC